MQGAGPAEMGAASRVRPGDVRSPSISKVRRKTTIPGYCTERCRGICKMKEQAANWAERAKLAIVRVGERPVVCHMAGATKRWRALGFGYAVLLRISTDIGHQEFGSVHPTSTRDEDVTPGIPYLLRPSSRFMRRILEQMMTSRQKNPQTEISPSNITRVFAGETARCP